MRHYAAFPISSVKAIDGESGTFEAIVSVFGNVDFAGDRIIEGAFANSLEAWKASGDPIPVIWSHQWHDLDSYIGEADPSEVRELGPGDSELPEAIRDLGGLAVKAKVDTDDPAGRKALKLLKRRAVREFSFAYDVVKERTADDGANELLEIDLIEVGPTLKGANPLTQLVGAKAETIRKWLPEGDVAEVRNLVKALEDALAEDDTEEEELEELDLEDGKALRTVAGILDRLDAVLKDVGLELAIKAGARNSAADAKRIQTLHDLTIELGSACSKDNVPDSSSEDEEDDEDAKDGDEYINAAVLAARLDSELLEL